MKQLYELKQELKNNKLSPLYIFYGKERIVMNTYIDKIKKLANLPSKIVDSVSEISSNIYVKGIFNKDYIYVIKEDKDVLSKENAWNIMKQNTSKNIIILIYENLDKRNKFFSANEEYITEFEKLSHQVLVKHAIKNFDLDSTRAGKLVNRSNDDYGRMVLNGQKISYLSKIRNITNNESFDICVKEGLIPIISENVLFDFIDCVMYADFDNMWTFFKLLKNNDEPVIKILTILYNNFRNIFMIQSCNKGDNISQKTGLELWIINKMKDYLNIYLTENLLSNISLVKQAENWIKTGNLNEWLILNHCLTSIQVSRELMF